jgi:phosphatidylglycerol:prolipoprotein diacylglycerol transferase
MIVHPNFDPVAISLGPLTVHWYGLMYLAGFACGLLLGRRRAIRPGSGWQADEIIDLLFYIAVGVIAGGRLGYVIFYNPGYYFSHLGEIIALWDGGMSFHGGLIGVLVAMGVYARSTDRSYLAVSDFLAPLIPTGLFFGRIGNFINQELWGRVTDVSWGVMFYTAPSSLPRHPSQLYEAALEGVLLFAVLWWFSDTRRQPGQVSGLFVLGYGVFRFFVEFYREPDGHIGTVALDWMTMGQLLSVPMIVLGLYLLLRSGFNKPQTLNR